MGPLVTRGVQRGIGIGSAGAWRRLKGGEISRDHDAGSIRRDDRGFMDVPRGTWDRADSLRGRGSVRPAQPVRSPQGPNGDAVKVKGRQETWNSPAHEAMGCFFCGRRGSSQVAALIEQTMGARKTSPKPLSRLIQAVVIVGTVKIAHPSTFSACHRMRHRPVPWNDRGFL